MEQFLVLRRNLIDAYKKHETAINYVLKFLAAMVVFWRVNSVGMYREELSVLFNGATGFAFMLLIALIFAVSPATISLLLVAIVIALQLSMVVEVAIFVFLLLTLVIVFYARLAPRQSMLILAVVFGFYFRIPYAVVLFAGMYVGLASIIPIIIGTAVWMMLGPFTELARTAPVMAEFEIMEIPTAFVEIFGQIYEILTGNLGWLLIGFIFAMMILAVHLISSMSINFAREIALISGAAIGLVCMLMVGIVSDLDFSIIAILLGSVASVGIVFVVMFFDKVVDYNRVERVIFEDEDYVYHVKMTPKVKMEGDAKPAAAKPTDFDDDDDDDDDDLYRPDPRNRPRPVQPQRPAQPRPVPGRPPSR